jgi:hypothetical protein
MTDFTHSLAIIIGINAYGNSILRLTAAVNDATRLEKKRSVRISHGHHHLSST